MGWLHGSTFVKEKHHAVIYVWSFFKRKANEVENEKNMW